MTKDREEPKIARAEPVERLTSQNGEDNSAPAQETTTSQIQSRIRKRSLSFEDGDDEEKARQSARKERQNERGNNNSSSSNNNASANRRASGSSKSTLFFILFFVEKTTTDQNSFIEEPSVVLSTEFVETASRPVTTPDQLGKSCKGFFK